MPNFRDSIAATNAAFMTAFADRDASRVAATYTPGGQALPPNGDVVMGQSALTAMWQNVMNMGIKQAMVSTVELERLGDKAYEVGTYTMVADDDTVFDKGKYVIVWQRQPGGEWRWHRDIWNSSMPPTGD